MTKEEMVTVVKETITNNRKRFPPELVESLVDFYDEFDPYGMRDAFGDLTIKSHRNEARKNVRYALRMDPTHILDDLEEV